jgi:hypothetical protein
MIIISNFKLNIDLLNLKNHPTQLGIVGKGGYGTIYKIKVAPNKNIVAKRIFFQMKNYIQTLDQ